MDILGVPMHELVRVDCRHYLGFKPCAYHKVDGRHCMRCEAFAPVSTRILVVKTGALGDVLRCTVVLPALRRTYPRAHVTWLTAPEAVPLLAGNPLVDRLLTPGHATLATLMVERFDLVLGLDNDHPSATLASLAQAPERRGFMVDAHGRVLPANAGALAWWRIGLDDTLKRANRRTHAELMYELAELEGPVSGPQLPVTAAAAREAEDILAALSIAGAPRLVAVAIASGGRWQQKRWGAAHVAALLDLVAVRLPGVTPFLVGGPQDLAFNAEVRSLLKADVPCVDQVHPLPVVAGLLARSAALVTTDSLPLHMAAALRVPAVAVVGPTSPWEIAGDGIEVVATDRSCVSCYLEHCPHAVTCMDDLGPAAVFDGLRRVLGRCE